MGSSRISSDLVARSSRTATVERLHRTAPARRRALLGHPLAFLATALLILAVYGWTFVANPGRAAPGDDPAYYSWRTEALMSEEPSESILIDGPAGMLAGGYRVTSSILGGMLRRVAGVDVMTTTVIITTMVRCVNALLLGAFAYRWRRDPLAFHVVALAAASMFLTPPFYGYLDNMLALMFLTASLILMDEAAASLGARICVAGLLVAAGLTHPTTVVIFFGVLLARALLRLLARNFSLRSVLRTESPAIAICFLALVLVYAVWQVGIWGPSIGLTEAAVPPPADQDFFMARLSLWIDTMRPLVNGLLFVLGLLGVLRPPRPRLDEGLPASTVAWLAPLVGTLGFLAGKAYPYYRFFNTTLAWVLLIGLGAYFLCRIAIDRLPAAGAVVVIVLLGAAIFTNFSGNYYLWNDVSEAWLAAESRADLEALRVAVSERGEGRPVVFVIDTPQSEETRVYGQTKLPANVSRFGVPHGYQDRAYIYLGSVENFLAGRPTEGTGEHYERMSRVTLRDAQTGVEASGEEPIVVLASQFNVEDLNSDLFSGGAPPREEAEVWIVSDGHVVDTSGNQVAEPPEDGGSFVHLLWVIIAVALLLLPGSLLLSRSLSEVTAADYLSLAPVMACMLLTLTGLVVLGVVGSPLSTTVAWVTLGGAIVLALGARATLARTAR